MAGASSKIPSFTGVRDCVYTIIGVEIEWQRDEQLSNDIRVNYWFADN